MSLKDNECAEMYAQINEQILMHELKWKIRIEIWIDLQLNPAVTDVKGQANFTVIGGFM